MADDVVLSALRKEHKRYLSIAARAKQKADDYCSAGSDLIDVYKEFKEVLKIKDFNEQHAAVNKLVDREKKIKALLKLDLMKLTDKQIEAESKVRTLANEIGRLEFRASFQH